VRAWWNRLLRFCTRVASMGGQTDTVDPHPCEFGPIDALALSCPTRYYLAPGRAAASSDHRIMPKITLRAESSSSLKSGCRRFPCFVNVHTSFLSYSVDPSLPVHHLNPIPSFRELNIVIKG